MLGPGRPPASGPQAATRRAFDDYLLLIRRSYTPRRDRLPVFTDDQLRRLDVPLLVVAGARDRMLDSHDTTRRVHHLVPDAVVTLLPDTGHIPTGYLEPVQRFLSDARPGMNSSPEAQPTEDARVLRSMLRTDLVAAMKARRPDAVAALRTALAVIDNAEAVAAPDRAAHAASEHVAGARSGAGSTEAERRVLSVGEVRALLQAQIGDRANEADRYDTYGRHDAARQLRREADVLRKYLAT
ncbi:hypothetical protein ACFV80_16275 [Streptomyces sp. NPDC059862]|uniref:hypothetical protein n=1 Tax=Streptomyces sp. NPDC059862 TaxID=3346975 RepID=UPI0036620B5B